MHVKTGRQPYERRNQGRGLRLSGGRREPQSQSLRRILRLEFHRKNALNTPFGIEVPELALVSKLETGPECVPGPHRAHH